MLRDHLGMDTPRALLLNLIACHSRGLRVYLPPLVATHQHASRKKQVLFDQLLPAYAKWNGSVRLPLTRESRRQKSAEVDSLQV